VFRVSSRQGDIIRTNVRDNYRNYRITRGAAEAVWRRASGQETRVRSWKGWARVSLLIVVRCFLGPFSWCWQRASFARACACPCSPEFADARIGLLCPPTEIEWGTARFDWEGCPAPSRINDEINYERSCAGSRLVIDPLLIRSAHHRVYLE
jgi:hypothetical protein